MALIDKVSRFVKPKNLHKDRKSLEAATGIVKIKYKLAGNPLLELDQFVFFVCSSHSGAYHKKLLVRVKESEWLNRHPRFLGESCIDISRCEVMTSREVGLKMVDHANGFKLVAELPQVKFEELQSKLLKLRQLKTPLPRELKSAIGRALDATPAVLRKLGL